MTLFSGICFLLYFYTIKVSFVVVYNTAYNKVVSLGDGKFVGKYIELYIY